MRCSHGSPAQEAHAKIEIDKTYCRRANATSIRRPSRIGIARRSPTAPLQSPYTGSGAAGVCLTLDAINLQSSRSQRPELGRDTLAQSRCRKKRPRQFAGVRSQQKIDTMFLPRLKYFKRRLWAATQPSTTTPNSGPRNDKPCPVVF